MAPSQRSALVTKIPQRTNLPKEAESNPHHVTSGGNKDRVVKFKNPYPSYGPLRPFSQIIWYEGPPAQTHWRRDLD